MRLLRRTAAGLTCLLVVTACASETTSTSGTGSVTTDGTQVIEPGFRTVLKVDMKPGTSFEEASAVTDKYGRSGGVQSAGNGEGDAMFIFKSDATEKQVLKVREALLDESSVEQVNIEHRK